MIEREKRDSKFGAVSFINFMSISCPFMSYVVPDGSVWKESACNARDKGLIPAWGRSPGEGKSNPLHYSCMGNPMDRGVWWATPHEVAKMEHNLVTKHHL